jgi:hypothetical protein
LVEASSTPARRRIEGIREPAVVADHRSPPRRSNLICTSSILCISSEKIFRPFRQNCEKGLLRENRLAIHHGCCVLPI